ncbi:Ion transport domain-containing protein [Plasmodiophora brassicae]|uniref:Ion transport domain-containing protein n=1 Tax=Plasmodiophora brassicae TaxID=37360 RepID=A0A0G4ILR9_PLABS|nr:hypothetical protein PBRA_004727 [Plasmodiophora brassicae]SPQ93417.1 unnamed protein product [Plasmodiophora brassicae]
MIAGEAPGGVAAAESGDDRSISSYGDDLYNGFLKIMRNEVNMYKRAVTAYESSAIRSIVDVTLAFAGITSTVLFVVSSYFPNSTIVSTIELVLAIMFAVDFCISLFARGYQFLFTKEGIVDLLSVIPLIASPGDNGFDSVVGLARSNIAVIRVFKSLKALRVLRVVRVVRVYRVIVLLRDSVQQQIAVTLVIGSAIVVMFAAIFQMLQGDITFFNSCYFIAQTMTTVGFGEVMPTNVRSRLFTVLVAIATWTLIPMQAMRTIELSRQTGNTLSQFVPSDLHQHVILILQGPFAIEEIHEFLSEFFHTFHGPSPYRVVILGRKRTLKLLTASLKTTPYADLVDLVIGSVHEDNDLHRCALSLASAVFTLPHRSCVTRQQEIDEDNESLLAAISVKNVCPNVPVYVQVNNPEVQDHILWRTVNKFPNVQLICSNQLSVALLAQSCLCPGFHVLVGNLLQSYNAPSVQQVPLTNWIDEYEWGASHSVVPTVFSQYFHGRMFRDAALMLQEKLGIIPIALTTRDQHGTLGVALNPQDRVIEAGELVYVIARSIEHSAKVATFTMPEAGEQTAIDAARTFLDRKKQTSELSKRVTSDPKRSLQSAFQMDSGTLHGLSMPAIKTDRKRNLPPIIPIDSVEFSDHIIITGFIDIRICTFLFTFRKSQQYQRGRIPIVIVPDHLPDLAIREAIGQFEDVYMVIGSLNDDDLLLRINLIAASHTIMFSNPANGVDRNLQAHATRHYEMVVDTDVAAITNLIALERFLAKRKNPNASNVMFQLQFKSNLKFLRPNLYDAHSTNGRAQAQWNAPLPLLQSDLKFSSAAADAKVHLAGTPQSMAAMCFHCPHIFHIVNALLFGTPTPGHRSWHMQVALVAVPERFGGKPFPELSRWFADVYGFICIGLFRDKKRYGSPIPYIFSNPPPDAVVSKDDHAFVLATVCDKKARAVRGGSGVEDIAVITSLFRDESTLCSSLQVLSRLPNRFSSNLVSVVVGTTTVQQGSMTDLELTRVGRRASSQDRMLRRAESYNDRRRPSKHITTKL